ncbi:MAG: molybdenum cofactor biosynthesis protein C [Candidatus Firestonebacteria bacterium RIFOXYC2_FULL_39_67]|nr:MAG: molybdenum cofactor biosynthesis protein C [Candidatus Firestonebacteria bacterium RIFOXYC2_FULL_39_67]
MINVGNKKKTKRAARATAYVRLNREIVKKIIDNKIPKGSVLEIARVAGILAAKKTPELIPLCHNLEIEYVGIEFIVEKDGVLIESIVKSTGKTGVEMEALAAASLAALTIYDMCKMFLKSIEIQDIFLLEKTGGKSGRYVSRK